MKKTDGRFDFKLWPDSIGSPRRVAYSLFQRVRVSSLSLN